MTKQELLDLNDALMAVGGLTGVKFAYAVAKNVNIIKDEINAIKKAVEFSPEYRKFETERIKEAIAFAKKTPKGETMIADGKYIFENPKEWEKKFEEIKKKYKKAFDAREKQLDEFEKLLQEDVEVNLFLIGQEQLPAEIKTSELTGIFKIIK